MALSLGRALYNLGWRQRPKVETLRPARPSGELIWLNLPKDAAAGSALALARHLIEEDGALVLITSLQNLPLEGDLAQSLILQPPPAEAAADCADFLNHWKPTVGLFFEGELRPALIEEAAARKIPLMLINGRQPGLPDGQRDWYPGLLRKTLGEFTAINVVDNNAERMFRKAGAEADKIRILGRMEEPSAALPAFEAEREALAKACAARPIWFAATVPETEERSVLAAHSTAMSFAHRLLLVIAPADPKRAEGLADQLEAQGWVIARRDRDEEPDVDTAIYVVSDPAELGLWYRLAPITFLGGSLAGMGAIRSPLEPAALGSAILHGPRPGPHGVALGRLGAAHAARAVASTHDLAEALSDLLEPDRAARLAQAAWIVASDGAEATEEIIASLHQLIDTRP